MSNSNTGSNSNNSNLSPPIHQACANLMDELVSLWRIACLNPLLQDFEEKQLFREELMHWHQSVYERLKKFCNHVLANSQNSNNINWSSASQIVTATATGAGNNFERLFKRLDVDLFSGFLSAVNASDMSWVDFDFESIENFKQHCDRLINTKSLLT